jgi:hypothetical protein
MENAASLPTDSRAPSSPYRMPWFIKIVSLVVLFAVIISLMIHISPRHTVTVSEVAEARFWVGDLVLLWGKPETWRYCNTVVLTWRAPSVTALVHEAIYFSYFSTVSKVLFTLGDDRAAETLLMGDLFRECNRVRVALR